MDEDELRQFYLAAGAALSIGGFVVLATNAMTLAVTSLPHGTPWLAYADFGVAAIGLATGVTVIARALMGKSLIGSKRARRVGNNRLFAQECLGALLNTGQEIAVKQPEDRPAAATWLVEAVRAVNYFFGHARGSTLQTGMTVSKDLRPIQDMLQPSIHRLTSIIDQVHTLRLPRGFDRPHAKKQDWYQYLLVAAPYQFEKMLPPDE
jgi:hypothetical protein